MGERMGDISTRFRSFFFFRVDASIEGAVAAEKTESG